MCWLYEIEYGYCFDWFNGTLGNEDSIKGLLEDGYNTEIVDVEEFGRRVFDFLTELHEDGIIRPKQPHIPSEKELAKWFRNYSYKTFQQKSRKQIIRNEFSISDKNIIINWFKKNMRSIKPIGKIIRVTIEVLDSD